MYHYLNFSEDLFEPINILGNLYFVGTKPASCHLIDTGDGLIMLDTGYQHSLFIVIDNIHRMGFDPRDIKYILLTHGHIDHFGAARSLRELTGAKLALGKEDREYANGKLDLSYAKELDMKFAETFEPDILLSDGDKITLGNTTVRTVATPGHTPGAMSYFFDVHDGEKTFRAGLHGGMGINTLCREFLDTYHLPYSLREDFVRSMHRLQEETVEIFLGNHMQHNHTEEKALCKKNGEYYAFVNPDEWYGYNSWCIDNLNHMIERENQK
ncbi:MAG: MBL fold metallo-hydrolase [Clostridia bacterium]|nr:MBL fold metallo-hydrolase [Clostridia bacterium]